MEYNKKELEIIKYWKEIDLLRLGTEKSENDPLFNFIEGPPTANGKPGAHHVLTRSIKDLINRYKFMSGYSVPRKAGWDCHGLPVEIEVEKELNLKTKRDILKIGIEKFNKHCRENVFKYKSDWEELTDRMGFWLDLSNPYMTLSNDYIESIWWSLKEIWKQGLLTEDYKIIAYCPRCQTPLSSHEVSLGYQNVEDPSIILRYQSASMDNTYYLVWTTTPWTLVSNLALALNPDTRYVLIKYFDKDLNKEVNYILARDCLEQVFAPEDKFEILKEYFGSDLVDQKYIPLYDLSDKIDSKYYDNIYRTVNGDFVTTDRGTGIVHIAPAFGEDDFHIGKVYDLPVFNPINEDGTFNETLELVANMYFKDADKIILKDLRTRKILFNLGTIKHDYPFCWRCKTALVYYAKKSWFIRMSERRDDLVEFNERINWIPDYIKYGRFGNFLDEIKDWALSRDRYWGTPLPIWVCTNEECNYKECIGSVAELKEKQINKDYEIQDLHRPYVDKIILKCPKCSSDMHRVPQVIDCWYDSGAATFAQFHYPFENQELFKKSFPYDFISEALDQTRGWFYTLHAISTILFKTNAYKNVICAGLITDEYGEKMSKSKGNVIDPWTVFNTYGADAFRWYYYSSGELYKNKALSLKMIKTKFNQFIVTLWNSYRYLMLNLTNKDLENMEKFDIKNFKVKSLIDKWIISRINTTIKEVIQHLENYHIYPAATTIEKFVINDFSNWYIRIIRKRIDGKDRDLILTILIYILEILTRLVAPFIPFLSERIYLDSDKLFRHYEVKSIHLCPYPKYDESSINSELEKNMQTVQNIVQELRGLRNKHGIRIRQPLSRADIYTVPKLASILKNYVEIIGNEVNIKKINILDSFDEKNLQNIISLKYELDPELENVDITELKKYLDKRNLFDIFKYFALENKPLPIPEVEKNFSLRLKDIKFFVEPKNVDKYAADISHNYIIILDCELTEDLLIEGFKRELIRRIQQMRKDKGLKPKKEKITIYYEADPPEKFDKYLNIMKDDILQQTSGIKFVKNIPKNKQNQSKVWKIQDFSIKLYIELIA
ncbi:MAG: isoleucine--tRNA ligase [Candidatus Helarchaeota archaeon]